MKHSKLLLLASLPLLLAGCGGNAESSSPTPTPSSPDTPVSSSDAPVSSESPSSSGSRHSGSTFGNTINFNSKRFSAVTEGSEYKYELPNFLTITLEKMDAEKDIVVGTESITLPAKGKCTLTLLGEEYYLADSSVGRNAGVTFVETPSADWITLDGATGTVEGNKIAFSYTSSEATTVSFVANVDVVLESIYVVRASR